MNKLQIKKELGRVLKELNIEDIEINIDYPADSRHGDYSTNLALVAAKRLNKTPLEVAEKIAELLKKGELLFDVQAVKPGFINLSLTKNFLIQKMQNINKNGFEFSAREKGKRIMVEFAHPNTHKA